VDTQVLLFLDWRERDIMLDSCPCYFVNIGIMSFSPSPASFDLYLEW